MSAKKVIPPTILLLAVAALAFYALQETNEPPPSKNEPTVTTPELVPLTHPQQNCPVCNGVGATRVAGHWVRCAVCSGDGVIDDDPRDPEQQPGFNPQQPPIQR